jgi:Tfp pilus assembly protein PilV
MMIMKKNIIKNEKGFVLMAALIACLILLAIGMLVINMSTGELFTTSELVGQKKAIIAAESGVTKILNDGFPENWTAANSYTEDANCGAEGFTAYTWLPVQNSTDITTQFAVCAPRVSSQPAMPAPGYALGGGGGSTVSYGYMRYDTTAVGRSTVYKAQTKIDVGVGFGPVPIGGN